MKRERRLRKQRDFQAVLRMGRRWATPMLVLRALPNTVGTTRVGFSVGRSVGNAVVRNRVKRRLREVVRRTAVQEGWDLVIIARASAREATFAELQQAWDGLLNRGALAVVPSRSNGP